MIPTRTRILQQFRHQYQAGEMAGVEGSCLQLSISPWRLRLPISLKRQDGGAGVESFRKAHLSAVLGSQKDTLLQGMEGRCHSQRHDWQSE